MTVQSNQNMKTTRQINNWAAAILLLSSAVGVAGTLEISNSAAPGLIAYRTNGSVRPQANLNGITLAVSHDGKLLTSSNGVEWTEVRLTFKTFLRGITCADGLFVVVGGSYVDRPGVILTSRNGTTWTLRESGTRANLYGVTHGNGIFVAVGDNQTVLTSKNGINWKQRTSITADLLLSSIAFGDGAFVAVGDSGTVLTSTDSVRWQVRNSGSEFVSKQDHETTHE